MDKPIRVMHVMGRMTGGGVEATIMNHYRHIDREKVQFDFVVDDDSTVIPQNEIESLGGHVYTVPSYKRLAEYLITCHDLFTQVNPTIVHSNINSLSVFPLYAAKQAGIPIRIAHSHSTASPKEGAKTIMKMALRPFSKVFPTHYAACSEYAARWLFGNDLVDTGKVKIIKNAIDTGHFAFNASVRDRKRSELGLTNDQFVVGQVGRMCPQKNQLFSLDIFSQLLSKKPNSVLVLVGDGDMMNEVESKIELLGIKNSVRLLGIRSDVAELYQAFDVLLFPSLYEGLPLTGVEAQMSGLPIVASSTISKETKIIDPLFHSISLDASLDQWVDMLLESACKRRNREDSYIKTTIVNAGYDIYSSARDLTNWYLSIE